MQVIDEATGVMDRKSFYTKVRNLLNEYTDLEFELMVTDVERFHVANELLGEEASDKLLQQMGECLQKNEFELSAVGRLYSDHFAILYPAKQSIREHIIRSLQEVATDFSDYYMITLDFGIYPVKQRDLAISVMCDRARLALQQAKGNYLVNCRIYDDSLHRSAVRQQFVVNSMEEALVGKQFHVWLQPKYDLRTEQVVGAEALVRWQHPKYGNLSPAVFIPIFEDNGFIMKLDAYIWEETCRLLARWRTEGRILLPVSVNISRVDLHNPHLSDILQKLVEKYALPPSLLELEITESAYMEDAGQIIAFTEKLRQQGFTILMDDFGSGYSSLNMLKNVPVDILKLDLHFLSSDDTSGRGGNILNSIVRMAKWLNLEVIVEGVETKQQVEFLRSIGCWFVQGYYYSKPLPVEEYEKLLTASHTSMSAMQATASRSTENVWSPLTQYNLLFNNMACGIALVALSSVGLELVRGNDGYYALLRLERTAGEEAKVQQALPFVWPQDEEALQEALTISASQNKQTGVVIRYQRPEGMAWLDISVVFVTKEMQQTLFYLMVHDVTRQQERGDMLQTLFNELPSGIGVYEMQGEKLLVKYVSQSIIDFHGLSEEKQRLLRAKKIYLSDLVGEDSARVLLQVVRQAYEKHEVFRLQYPVQDREGKYCWVSIVGRGATGANGRLMFYASFTQMMDKPFLQQRMWIYDLVADRLYLGRYLQRLFNTKSMVIEQGGRYLQEYRWIRKEDAPSFYATLDKLYAGAAEGEWSGVGDIQGKEMWTHLVFYTIFDEKKKPVMIVCSSV